MAENNNNEIHQMSALISYDNTISSVA